MKRLFARVFARRRTATLFAVLAAVTIVLAGGAMAQRVAATPPPDAFVVDGPPGEFISGGEFDAYLTPADGTIIAQDSFFHLGDHRGLDIGVYEPLGSGTIPVWTVWVLAPAGQQIGVGTWSGTSADPYGVSGYMDVLHASNGSSGAGSITITELTWGADNRVATLAATFSWHTDGGATPLVGQVRIGTSMDLNLGATAFTNGTLQFPASTIGTLSAPRTVTLTSTGKGDVTLGTPTMTGPNASSFDITADTCDGATLPRGTTCTITVAVNAQTTGDLGAQLSVPSSSLTGSRWTWAWGHGQHETTTTLTVSKTKLDFLETFTWSVAVTPNPGGGWVRLCSGCGEYALNPLTGTAKGAMQPGYGQFTLVGLYDGGLDYAPSKSDPVDFEVATPETITTWSSWSPAAPDRLVMVAADAIPKIVWYWPTDWGTIQLVDADTGKVLAQSAASPDAHSVYACLRASAPVRHLVAKFVANPATHYATTAKPFDQTQGDTAPPPVIEGPPFAVTAPATPCADLQLAGGAATTSTPTVDLDFDWVHLGTGSVDEVAFSNDGATWSGGSASGLRTWSLTDPAFGGTDADGAKTVWARYRIGATWSDPVTASIVLDRAAPIVSAQIHSLPVGSTMAGSSVPAQISWSGTAGPSGIASYRLEMARDGVWSTVVAKTTASHRSVDLAPGHRYQFRVTATSGAGITATLTGSQFGVTAFAETSPSIVWHGTWSRSAASTFVGGATRYSATVAATATITTTRRGFAWISAVGPTRGSARIYVNGILVKTVNLHATTPAARRIVFAVTWATAARRSVVIRVVGTPGHPRVDIDGFLAWD